MYGRTAYNDRETSHIVRRDGVNLKNIDKKMLDSLLGLSDERLMQMLRLLSGTAGLPSSKPPSAETVAGIRSVLRSMTDADLARATELISAYKEGKKG